MKKSMRYRCGMPQLYGWGYYLPEAESPRQHGLQMVNLPATGNKQVVGYLL